MNDQHFLQITWGVLGWLSWLDIGPLFRWLILVVRRHLVQITALNLIMSKTLSSHSAPYYFKGWVLYLAVYG